MVGAMSNWEDELRNCQAILGSPGQHGASTRMSASLIGRLGSSTFQTIHHYRVDVARWLVLLFGIGTRALPSWDSGTRWNNLYRGVAIR